MKNIIIEAKRLQDKKNSIVSTIKEEKFDDLHSFLRAKELIYSYLETEVKLSTHLDIINILK